MAFERELHRAASGEEGLDLDLEREKAARLKRKKDAELAARVPGKRTLVEQLPVPPEAPASVLEYRARGMRDVVSTMGAIARGERSGVLQTTPAMGETMMRVADRRAHTLMRRAQDHGDVDAHDPAVEESLAQMGGGAPLPEKLRKKMEAEFGVSFDRVRVHTDGVAAQAAAAVHAEAFTVGEDIFFAEGAFDPASKSGQHLIAHELTHVVQGMEGRVAAAGGVSKPGESLETEAERRAENVVARGSTPRVAPVRPQIEAPRGPRTVVVAPAPAAAPGVHSAPIMRRPAAGVAPNRKGKGKGKITVQATRDPNDKIPHIQHEGRAKLDEAKGRLHQATHGAKAHAHNAIAQAHSAASTPKHAASPGDEHKDLAHAVHKGHEKAHHAPHHPTPHHDESKHGDKNAGTGGIKLKPVGDWEKLAPPALPDQDEREKKKILGLVKHKVEKDRAKSAKLLSSLKAAQLKASSGIAAMKGGLQAEIAGAQRAALGKVSSAEAAQVASVQSHIAGLQAQVRGAASAAVASVDQAHQQTIAQMAQAFAQANQKLAQDHTTALSKLQADTTAELTAVSTQFEEAESSIRAYGGQKASEASAMGDMALSYSGDQLDAARKAAHEVAEKYATAMPENANQAAEQVGKSLPDAQDAVRHTSDAFKEQIDTAFNQAKDALQTQHQQMVQAANQAHQQSVSSIRQASSAAISALGALQSQTVAGLHSQAASARAGISSAGAAAIAGVGSTCDKAAAGLKGGAEGVIQAAAKMETPDPRKLGLEVAKARKELSKGAAAAAAGMKKSAGSSAASLAQQATSAAGGLAQAASAANTAAGQQAQAAEQGIRQTAQQATQAQHKIGEEFKKTSTKLVTQTQTGLEQANEHAKSAFEKQTTTLEGKLKGFVDGCKGKLDEAVPGKERPDILAQAAKAAASVPKHWWQKVVSFVVKVVIAVAIGVAVGALIVATGGVGGVLLAVAIGAAGGALGYTASLVAGNLIEGKAAFDNFSWKGLAVAAVAGGLTAGATSALGSLASGATSGFLGAFAEGASGLGNFAIKTATDFGISMVSDAIAQKAITGEYKVTLEDVLLTAATAGISNSTKLVGGAHEGGSEGGSEGAGGGGGEADLGAGGGHGGEGGSNEAGHGGGSNETQHAGGANDNAAGAKGGADEAKSGAGAGESNAKGGANEAANDNAGAGKGGKGGADEGGAKTGANDNANAKGPEGKGGTNEKTGGGEKGGADEAKSGTNEKGGGENKSGSNEKGKSGGEDEKAGANDKSNSNEKAGNENKSNSKGGEDEKAGANEKSNASDKAANDNEKGSSKGGEDEKAGGNDKSESNKKGEHEGNEDQKEGGEGGKKKVFDKHKAHEKLDEALHPKTKGQKLEDVAKVGEKTSDVLKDKGREDAEEKKKEKEEEEKSEKETEEHSHPEMPELEIPEKELEQDGYAAANPRTAAKAASSISSGRAPDAKDLRATKANHEGRAEIEKRLADPNISPEEKQKLQNELAGRVQNGPAPTGNLHRDVHEASKSKPASSAPAGGSAPAHAQDPAAPAQATAPATAGADGAAPAAKTAKPDEAKDTAHQPPPPLAHMAQYVFDITGSGAIQKALVFVSAGQLTLTPDVFFFFHGQWANYGIDPEQYAALVAKDEKKDATHNKAWHDKKYLESGRAAITEAMQHAQGHNLISIVPQGAMGGGGSNGGEMNTLHKKGSLTEVIASVMKQLQAKLHGDLMTAGRISISGHSAGGYEGVQQALAASGSMKDTITDVTLMDQEYGGGGQYEQVLGWMLHGKPGKSLRVVAESNQLRVGQFDEKTHQAKGLWDRFIGPDALPAKAHAAGFTVVDKGGAGKQQGANKKVVYHAQVMKGSEVQCDVLVLQSSLSHHPLRDDVMDDAALNIGQGAAGNTTFGTMNHGAGGAEVATPAAVSTPAPVNAAASANPGVHAQGPTATPAQQGPKVTPKPAPSHDVAPHADEQPQHNPDPNQPEHPPKIHVPKVSSSPDIYKEGGVLYVGNLTPQGLAEKEFEFKKKVYETAVARRMKSAIFGGMDEKDLDHIKGWPLMHKDERYRKELLPSLYSLLGAMKRDYEAGKPARGISTKDVKGVGIVSGYRGPKQEMHLWDSYFQKYFLETKKVRESYGDPFGKDALEHILTHIAARKATPGHSNHSNGTAIDVWAQSKTHDIPNSFNNQTAWKASWHYAWLLDNAKSYNFRNYPAEAWHWEYDS